MHMNQVYPDNIQIDYSYFFHAIPELVRFKLILLISLTITYTPWKNYKGENNTMSYCQTPYNLKNLPYQLHNNLFIFHKYFIFKSFCEYAGLLNLYVKFLENKQFYHFFSE